MYSCELKFPYDRIFNEEDGTFYHMKNNNIVGKTNADIKIEIDDESFKSTNAYMMIVLFIDPISANKVERVIPINDERFNIEFKEEIKSIKLNYNRFIISRDKYYIIKFIPTNKIIEIHHKETETKTVLSKDEELFYYYNIKDFKFKPKWNNKMEGFINRRWAYDNKSLSHPVTIVRLFKRFYNVDLFTFSMGAMHSMEWFNQLLEARREWEAKREVSRVIFESRKLLNS